MFAELVNAIRTSVLGERVGYVSISEVGVNRDSKMRVLMQTTTFTTFVARKRSR